MIIIVVLEIGMKNYFLGVYVYVFIYVYLYVFRIIC